MPPLRESARLRVGPHGGHRALGESAHGRRGADPRHTAGNQAHGPRPRCARTCRGSPDRGCKATRSRHNPAARLRTRGSPEAGRPNTVPEAPARRPRRARRSPGARPPRSKAAPTRRSTALRNRRDPRRATSTHVKTPPGLSAWCGRGPTRSIAHVVHHTRCGPLPHGLTDQQKTNCASVPGRVGSLRLRIGAISPTSADARASFMVAANSSALFCVRAFTRCSFSCGALAAEAPPRVGSSEPVGTQPGRAQQASEGRPLGVEGASFGPGLMEAILLWRLPLAHVGLT